MALEELSNLLNSIQQGVTAINNLKTAVGSVTATSSSTSTAPIVINLVLVSS